MKEAFQIDLMKVSFFYVSLFGVLKTQIWYLDLGNSFDMILVLVLDHCLTICSISQVTQHSSAQIKHDVCCVFFGEGTSQDSWLTSNDWYHKVAKQGPRNFWYWPWRCKFIASPKLTFRLSAQSVKWHSTVVLRSNFRQDVCQCVL